MYLTEEQVWVAEVKMFKHELTEDKTYKKVYPSYRSECRGDTLKKIKSAIKIIRDKYIQNGSLPKRKAAALRWHEARYCGGAE